MTSPNSIIKTGKSHQIIGLTVREVTDEQEIEESVRYSIRVMNDKLIRVIDEKGVPEGTNIDLQYMLRSGYLIREWGDNYLENALSNKGFEVSHSVIGVSGDKIYAEPDLPKPGSITISLDTTAGSPVTMVTVANWHWKNRPNLDDDEFDLPKGWRWKNSAKYYVAALSTSNASQEVVRDNKAKLLEAAAISMPTEFFNGLNSSFPGRKLRPFFHPSGDIVVIGDLGDQIYGDNYQSLDEIQNLAVRFDGFAVGQKEAFVDYYWNKALSKKVVKKN